MGSIPSAGFEIMHKKTKGTIAEMSVAAHLIENGWHVSLPIGENNRYDLVAERDGRFARIQVKYVTPKNGALEVNCKSSNNWSVLHYTAKEIDVIAVYDGCKKSIYFVPVGKINRSSFKIRIDESKNNQKIKVHSAKEFLSLNF